jgi:hypothetical protein
MVSKTKNRLDLRARHSWRFKLLVAPVASLYLLISALLILCLTHPHGGHSHGEADGHFHFVCVWVQKAVSSHTPSPRVTLPLAESVLFLLLSFRLLVPRLQIVHFASRSPPTSPAIA